MKTQKKHVLHFSGNRFDVLLKDVKGTFVCWDMHEHQHETVENLVSEMELEATKKSMGELAEALNKDGLNCHFEGFHPIVVKAHKPKKEIMHVAEPAKKTPAKKRLQKKEVGKEEPKK